MTTIHTVEDYKRVLAYTGWGEEACHNAAGVLNLADRIRARLAAQGEEHTDGHQ